MIKYVFSFLVAVTTHLLSINLARVLLIFGVMLTGTVLISCDGADDDIPIALSDDEARYEVTFTAKWTSANFQTVPSNAHFTTLAGATTQEGSGLWGRGVLASEGFESLAETGSTSTFLSEITAEVEGGRALRSFTLSGTGAVGESSKEVVVNPNFPFVTLATMVAPSPDWFVGLSNFSLLDDEGEWVEDSGDIALAVYDAGTEDATEFTLGGTATVPAEAISRLTETVAGSINFVEGMVNGEAIASIRWVRVE